MRRRVLVIGFCIACTLTVATEPTTYAETPSPWMLGGHANISADSAGEVGWLLGVGVGARHPMRPWLDLQFRLFATYRASAWQRIEGRGAPPQAGDVGEGDSTHVLAEATARWRLWGPLFLGLGPQAGVRSQRYSELFGTYVPSLGSPQARAGTDTRPVVRGVFELGADFGPREMLEVGFRIAVGDAFGTGPVDRISRGDAELAFTLGVLFPL